MDGKALEDEAAEVIGKYRRTQTRAGAPAQILVLQWDRLIPGPREGSGSNVGGDASSVVGFGIAHPCYVEDIVVAWHLPGLAICIKPSNARPCSMQH